MELFIHVTNLNGAADLKYRASIHEANDSLTARARKVSKPRNSGLVQALWNLTGISAEMPVKFQSDTNIISSSLSRVQ